MDEKRQHRKLYTAVEIYQTEYPDIEYVIKDMIPAVGLTLICGASKIGKMNRVPNERLLVATEWSSNGKGIEELQNTLEDKSDIKVVVIDTYGRFAAGREESNFQRDYDWMSRLKDFADRNEIAVILIHHTRKMRDEADCFNDISGSTANMAAADSSLLLLRTRGTSKGTLVCTSRDYADRSYSLDFSSDTCTWTLLGEEQRRASTPERQQILEVLLEYGELSPKEIAEYTGKTAKNISNMLGLMKTEGLVVQGARRGYWRSVESESCELSFSRAETRLSYDFDETGEEE
jgi:hypothetical protein